MIDSFHILGVLQLVWIVLREFLWLVEAKAQIKLTWNK